MGTGTSDVALVRGARTKNIDSTMKATVINISIFFILFTSLILHDLLFVSWA